MVKKLFLLDGMALVYRAHFALVARPIFTSKGVNTSALYGFTQTLLEILKNQQPTHIAVAFDTDAPTQRHAEFADYKATRQAMPEDITKALPHVKRMLEAFNIPVLTCDGYEADDIIETVVRHAETKGFKCYMVTPDKDFGQLVNENVFVYKPSRMGDAAEVLGLAEIQKRRGAARAEQVVDVLALVGDASDNIPGVPGIGEKTAIKLVAQFGSLENLLAHVSDLSGRVRETLEKNRETAVLSKRLATLCCDVPCEFDMEKLQLRPPQEDQLKGLFVEFEFNSIGRRLFGDEFRAGRGFQQASGPSPSGTTPLSTKEAPFTLTGEVEGQAAPQERPVPRPQRSRSDVEHSYKLISTENDRKELLGSLREAAVLSLALVVSHSDPKQARVQGLAFCTEAHRGAFVPLPEERSRADAILEEFRAVLESEAVEKVGHNLKFDASVLRWHGFRLKGKLFDTMIAHSLIEPDMRHSFEYVSEGYLGYTPAVFSAQQDLSEAKALPAGEVADMAV